LRRTRFAPTADPLAVPEKIFQRQVEQLAVTLGWAYYHTFNSYRSVQGFPDLVLVNETQRRTVFAELKSEKGKPTSKQLEWLRVLAAAGNEAYLWRPSDFDGIVRVLRRRTAEPDARAECPETALAFDSGALGGEQGF
jgi:hypothetical protein